MGTLTINYGLYKPAYGEQGYDDEVNQNFNIIDEELADHEDRLDSLELDGGGGHVIQDTGTPLAEQPALNFVGFLVADNPGNGSTDVTFVPTVPDGHWAPLTDGDLDDPQIVYAEGQAVMVFVEA